MIITKKSLARRTFLRGIGTTLALPLFDAMMPAMAGTTAKASQAVRLGFVYVPNGIIQKGWLPSKVGTGFEMASTMKPLEAHRDHLVVLSNLMQNAGRALGDGAGDHARAGRYVSRLLFTAARRRWREVRALVAGVAEREPAEVAP